MQNEQGSKAMKILAVVLILVAIAIAVTGSGVLTYVAAAVMALAGISILTNGFGLRAK
ncbi:hypothetical protein RB625_33495 [Streptomyces californicus]|uniref:hypothetical protein n=1 Tax=Streptomyces californicus TaxID=67351 RepID=UPI00296EB6BF|nr:hypothetical protein [Streptomyces californicus]MDW4903329.1 hypothetical protein [Streptomyces californicus]